MEKTEIALRNDKLATAIKTYSSEEIAVIRSTVAKGASDLELAYFLNVAKMNELNPFNKEIWCYKDNKQNVIIFAGRDGFLAKAQKSARWNGITSGMVRENDAFDCDFATGKISHKKNFKDGGKILGAYAICKPKGTELPTIEWADFDTYNKGYNVWKTHPEAMIKKIAETNVLKKAYGISGLQSEYEFEIDQRTNTAYALNTNGNPSINERDYAYSLMRTSNYDDDSRDFIDGDLSDKDLSYDRLNEIIRDLKMNQAESLNPSMNEIKAQLDNRLLRDKD
jgi:phage recombination protein Bet